MNKRIVLILSSFPKLSESFIVNKFLGLSDRGWDVHIVCQKIDKNGHKHFPQLETDLTWRKRVHRYWPIFPKWLSFLLLPFALLNCMVRNPRATFIYLKRAQKKHGWNTLKRLYIDQPILILSPDLIHFEFGATAVGRADLGYLLDCKMVVSFRGYDLNFSGLDQPNYYSDVWLYSDGFHYLGNDLRERGLRRGCPPEKSSVLIPPAIDIEFFRPTLTKRYAKITDNHPLRILSVGRLEWKKGYEYGFQAVKMLGEKGIKIEYYIIGDGAYLDCLAFTRHQLGLDNVIHFLGAQPRDKVKERLNWADLFLHSAVSEGFCNAVLEAQAMQVPVVCTDADGLSENIEDGVTGFVVPRRNSVALAEKMTTLAVTPMIRERFGLAGRERVIRYFQLNKQIDKFSDFYQNIFTNE